MLTVSDVSRRYRDTLLFEHVTFSINLGDRIGLVGPNGSGKSSPLRILTGEEGADTEQRQRVSRRNAWLPAATSRKAPPPISAMC